MIDVWLLFAMFVPFMEVILHTQIAKNKQIKSQDEEKSQMIGRKVQVLPIAEENEMTMSLDLKKPKTEESSLARCCRIITFL